MPNWDEFVSAAPALREAGNTTALEFETQNAELVREKLSLAKAEADLEAGREGEGSLGVVGLRSRITLGERDRARPKTDRQQQRLDTSSRDHSGASNSQSTQQCNPDRRSGRKRTGSEPGRCGNRRGVASGFGDVGLAGTVAALETPVAGEAVTVVLEELHHLLVPGIEDGEPVEEAPNRFQGLVTGQLQLFEDR